MEPTIRYTKCGHVHLAYRQAGAGPRTVLVLPAGIGTIDHGEDPVQVRRAGHLFTSLGRLVQLDLRGTGLSDPLPAGRPLALSDWVDDAVAVLDAVGTERATLFAANMGTRTAILLAATHPERVENLVLWSASGRPITWRPSSRRDESVDSLYDRLDADPSASFRLEDLAPSAADDERLQQWFRAALRRGASASAAIAIYSMIRASDLGEAMAAVTAPTLVMHRSGDRLNPIEEGRFVASQIPGARFVEFNGDDNLYFVGDTDAVFATIEEFVTGTRSVPGAQRIVATLLFTDIVGSTTRAAELGDRAWRVNLASHDQIVTSELARWAGRLVKSTGDGVLATFDDPGRAVACACTIRDKLHLAGIEIRAGLHTGQIEVVGDDVAGIAVHIAQRVQSLGGAGEVLASRTVADILFGSDVRFSERGTHQLKGVPGVWEVVAVDSSGSDTG